MEKWCKYCSTMKSTDDFYKNQCKCKSCRLKYQREYRKRRPDIPKKYKAKNRKAINRQQQEYRSRTKEKVREYTKKYYPKR